VSGFNPTSGPVGGSVVISGTGFTNATTVAFNGTGAATFTVNNDGQITAALPSGATTGQVSVTTVTGTGTSTGSFTVTAPAPSISGFSPTSGPVGTQVTISGTNLGSALSVTIGGVAATINSNSATQIVASVGSSAITGPVSLTTAGGSADSTALSPANFTVTVVSTPPVINSFTPTSGGPGTVVTMNGANLTGTNSVTFNGAPAASFSFVNDSQITATAPASVTTGPISVTNGSGSTDTSALAPPNFTVSGATRLKDITFEAASLTGTSGFATTSGTVALETASPIKDANAVTINGGNSFGTQTFTASDEVFISLYVRLVSIPSGEIRMVRITDGGTSVGAITLESNGKITLRGGTTNLGASSSALVAGTVYRIGIHQKKGSGGNSVLEGFLATGDADFGAPFASNSAQSFATQADSVQVGASTSVVGNVTFDDIRIDTGAMPGPSLPGGPPGPALLQFSPMGGPPGTSVTVSGSNFGASQGLSTVKVGGEAATVVTAWNDTSITATVPTGAVTGTITVTTAAGTGTSSGSFIVGAAPTISGFNPTSGPAGT
jgi:hypothetical protein